MKTLTDLRLLFWRPFVQNLRNPTWLFVGGSTPIMYLVLFTPLLKKLAGGPGFPAGHVLDIFLPGILVLLAFGSGSGAGFGTIFELKNGLVERLRVTPASRFALLMGPILSGLVWTFVFMALIVTLSVPFGFHIHLAGLLVFAVILALVVILFSEIGISLAILTKEIGTLAAIVNGINLPLILLAGVMLPLTLAPSWMRTLAHINPLYYAVESGRDLSVGSLHTHAVRLAFAVLIPLTLLVTWWSLRVYRKAVA